MIKWFFPLVNKCRVLITYIFNLTSFEEFISNKKVKVD